MFDQIKVYYKNIVPFITDDDWNALEENLTVLHVRKGEILLRNGRQPTADYLISIFQLHCTKHCLH